MAGAGGTSAIIENVNPLANAHNVFGSMRIHNVSCFHKWHIGSDIGYPYPYPYQCITYPVSVVISIKLLIVRTK